jgi:hypothetical protein
MRIDPDIRVIMEKEGHEPLMLWVNRSYLDFRFARDPHFPDLWVMLETGETEKFPGFEGRGAPAAFAVEGFTYSELKAMFD